MANSKQKGGFSYWANRIWHNYVVRNVLLAVVFTVIIMCVAALLLNIFTRHNKYRDVPDFVGLALDEAAPLARTDRLRIEVNDSLYVSSYPPGVILEQNPEPGSQVKSGRRIFVTVNSSRPKMVDVPYVAGYSLRQAKNTLERAGLIVERLEYVNYNATNYVLGQRVAGAKVTRATPVQAEVGSGVTLTVGRGADARSVVVPRVVGMSLVDARSRIIEAGLNVGSVRYDNEINAVNQRLARVYFQTPGPSGYQPLGAQVALELTIDSATLATGLRRTESSSQRNHEQRVAADSLANIELMDESDAFESESGSEPSE